MERFAAGCSKNQSKSSKTSSSKIKNNIALRKFNCSSLKSQPILRNRAVSLLRTSSVQKDEELKKQRTRIAKFMVKMRKLLMRRCWRKKKIFLNRMIRMITLTTRVQGYASVQDKLSRASQFVRLALFLCLFFRFGMETTLIIIKTGGCKSRAWNQRLI